MTNYGRQIVLLAQSANLSDEQIRSAVDDYVSEHGLTTGATADEAAQIERNTVNIAALDNDFTMYNYAKAASSETVYKLNADPVVTATSQTYAGVKVECQAGDTFKIKGVGGQVYRLYAFCDENGNRLLKSDGTTEGNNTYDEPIAVTAPEGTVCLYSNLDLSYDGSYIIQYPDWLKSFEDMDDFYAPIEDEIEGTIYDVKTLNNAYSLKNYAVMVGSQTYNITATTVSPGSSSSTYSGIQIACKPGDKFKIKGVGGLNYRLYAFADEAGNTLASSGGTTDGNNKYDEPIIVTAPESTVYLYCNINTVSEDYKDSYIITYPDWLENVENLVKADEDGGHVNGIITMPQMPDIHGTITSPHIDITSDSAIDDIYAVYDSLVSAYPDYVTKTTLGMDASGTYNIYRYDFAPETVPIIGEPQTGSNFTADNFPVVFMTACIHGEEHPCARALANFMYAVATATDNSILGYLRRNVKFIIIPVVNPWGYVNGSRGNANNVDLNRNFATNWESGDDDPTSDRYRGSAVLSEPETQYVNNILSNNADAITIFYDLHTHGVFTSYDLMTAFSVGTKSQSQMVLIGMDIIETVTASGHTNHNLPSDSGYIGTVMYSTSDLGGKACLAASALGIPAAAPELMYRYYDGNTGSQYNNNTNSLNTEYVLYAVANAIQTFAC